MSKHYELKTLKDILEIPEDRMDSFLPELKTWHQQVHAWREYLAAIADGLNLPPDFEVATQGMTWVDDGKRDIRVELKAAAALSPQPRPRTAKAPDAKSIINQGEQ